MYKINYSYLNQKAGAEPNIEGKNLLIENLEKKKNEIFNEVQNKEFKYVGKYFKFPFFIDTEFLKIVIEFYKYIYSGSIRYVIEAKKIFGTASLPWELYEEYDTELSNIYSFYKFDQISDVFKETINKDKQLFSNNNNPKDNNLNNILNNLENNVNDAPLDFSKIENEDFKYFTSFYFYSFYEQYRTNTIYNILVHDFTILKFYKNIFIDKKTLKEKTFKIFQDFKNFNSILDHEQELEISLEFINNLINSRNKLFNDYHENFFRPDNNFYENETNEIIKKYDQIISEYDKLEDEDRDRGHLDLIKIYNREKEDLITHVNDAKEKYKNLQTPN